MLTPTFVESPPLMLFGRDHLGALLAVAGSTVMLCIALRERGAQRASLAARRAVCWGLAGLLVVNDVAGSAWELSAGVFDLKTSLPLHLCDLAVYATAWALICAGRAAPSQGAFELAYYWGLAGTSQGLITPEISDPFPTAAYFRFFIMHGGIVAAVLAMTIGLQMRPRPGSVNRCLLITGLTAIPVAVVNWWLDANYMYLCGPPRRASLYDYFGRWPWSLVTLGVVGWLMMSACYFPFALVRRARPRPATGQGIS